MSVKSLGKNANILNINLIHNSKLQSLEKTSPMDLQIINSIVNSRVSPKYKVIKYLGEGLHGSLYLAVDENNNRFICKRVILDDVPDMHNQLNFELNVLKYLSQNTTTREYINPCLEHSIIDNNVYTIFPVFDGYSLAHYKKYLAKLRHTDYYKLVFHLIKVILHGMAKIHQTHIAHQNITDNAILISSNQSPSELYIKFTDFGLGCGYINSGSGNILDIKDYEDDTFFQLATCKENSNIPLNIIPEIKQQLSQSGYLQLSQKYDLFCLGILFLELLLFFDNLDIDLSSGYNSKFIEHVKRKIIEKYTTSKPSTAFPLLNIPPNVKRDILKYLKLFNKYIFCPTNDRKSCQYILDKIVIYEKYKNDIF